MKRLDAKSDNTPLQGVVMTMTMDDSRVVVDSCRSQPLLID